ncbi:hypothetical protein ACW2Q0_28250 [Nocardia sp. R16R-3T]
MPTILAVNGDLAEIAGRLLAAAGDQPDRVQIVTGGRYPGVAVDDELARAAGFLIDKHESVEDQTTEDADSSMPVVSDEPAENPESDSASKVEQAVTEPTADASAEAEPAPEPAPEPEPKKAPAKRTSSRSTAK